jgi:23S rRNA pseudouridine1911/1915/1917 synthase
VVGDEKYGAKTNPAGRLGLHASSLRFRHPVGGEDLGFTSPLPKILARLV